jgi:hypothetical protein
MRCLLLDQPKGELDGPMMEVYGWKLSDDLQWGNKKPRSPGGEQGYCEDPLFYGLATNLLAHRWVWAG